MKVEIIVGPNIFEYIFSFFLIVMVYINMNYRII